VVGDGVNAADSVECLAYVRTIWHQPAPADPNDDLEMKLYIDKLADPYITQDDAKVAIDRFTGSYPPTVLQIHEAARRAASLRLENGIALPEEIDDRPMCCRTAGHAFAHWIETHATDEDKQSVARFPELGEKYGITLEAIGEGVTA
jgi:hypothetical protein